MSCVLRTERAAELRRREIAIDPRPAFVEDIRAQTCELNSERKMAKHLRTVVVGAVVLAAAGIIVAQTPALTRTMVTKADVSVPGREAVIARVEIAPGGVAGWHTHPGDEISYVMDGAATLMIAGQPPRQVSAGEGFVIPAGVVHNAKNDGASAIKLVGVYVVEKGKPLASPASAPSP
jgi:quercetin dioxygenase-like cupin family protein